MQIVGNFFFYHHVLQHKVDLKKKYLRDMCVKIVYRFEYFLPSSHVAHLWT